ncbi:MAG: twin-arginine translocase TatA/TatE family subunit [Caldilineales bacterium]
MNLFGVGSGELIFILVIALLVMGPERLPQIARQWAKVVKTFSRFTRAWQQINAEINRELILEEQRAERAAASAPATTPVPDPEPRIAPPALTAAPPAAEATATTTPAEDAP